MPAEDFDHVPRVASGDLVAVEAGVPDLADFTLAAHVRDTYIVGVIRTFRDRRTAMLFAGEKPKGIGADIAGRVMVKLTMIDAAATLDFLRSPRGNRLEALKGDRAGRAFDPGQRPMAYLLPLGRRKRFRGRALRLPLRSAVR
jgi:plasmid maintenance system killer protein